MHYRYAKLTPTATSWELSGEKTNTKKPPLDISDWVQPAPLLSPTTPSPASASKKAALSRPPPVPKWKSETLTTKKQSLQAPIDLSLADEEALGRAARVGLNSESPEVASAARKIGSPVENGDADLLYEYFPLSVDHW